MPRSPLKELNIVEVNAEINLINICRKGQKGLFYFNVQLRKVFVERVNKDY
jgi:hypothetical protein